VRGPGLLRTIDESGPCRAGAKDASYTSCSQPAALVCKEGKDTKFRAEVTERIGFGFELLKAETVEVVPSLLSFQTAEVTLSIRKISRRLAPRARFELATLRLTAECSTVELPGNGQVDF